MQVGLWIYELAGHLPNGPPILLHCDMQATNKKFQETTPVHTAVSKWVDIIQLKGHANTILVFDSYYFSSKTRDILLQNSIKTCAAVTMSKFKEAVSLVEKRIIQPGDIEAVYNEPHKEFVLGYFNPDPQVSFFFIFLLVSISSFS